MRKLISRAEIFAIARSLGADPLETQHIEVTGEAVTVTAYKLLSNGGRYLDESTDEAAIEKHVIPIVGDGDAETVRMRHPHLPGQDIDVRPRGASQRAMSGWEVVDPPKDPPSTDPPPESGTKSEAPASTGASSSPAPRRRKTTKKEEG